MRPSSRALAWRLQLLLAFSAISMLALPVWWGAVSAVRGYDLFAFGLLQAASNIMRCAAGAAVAVSLARMDGRRIVIAAAALCTLAELATIAAVDVASFSAVRILFVAANGVIATLGIVYLGSLPDATRQFGWYVTVQVIVQAGALYLIPHLVAASGLPALQMVLAFCSLLVIPLAWSLPPKASTAQPTEDRTAFPWRRGLLALSVFVCFNFYTATLFNYTERFGTERALDPAMIGTILAISTLVGLPGSLAATRMGDRKGLLLPFACASLIMGVAITLLLLAGSGEIGFIIAVSLLSFAWSFGMPYVFGLAAKTDPTGRVLAASTAVNAISTAVLTLGATMFVTRYGVTPVGIFAAATVLLGFLFFLLALRPPRTG